jgi:hypothetical protein
MTDHLKRLQITSTERHFGGSAPVDLLEALEAWSDGQMQQAA